MKMNVEEEINLNNLDIKIYLALKVIACEDSSVSLKKISDSDSENNNEIH